MAYSDLRIVSAAELADELYARLVPTQLPAELSEWLAKYKGATNLTYVGWGETQLTLTSRINFDGTLTLQLADVKSAPIWETILRPIQPDPEPEMCSHLHCAGAEQPTHRITECPACAHTLVLCTP